jgi:hypothetical protein
VSAVYVYAVVRPALGGALGRGVRDEPLSVLTAGAVAAVVGEVDDAPATTPEHVRGHDAVVKRLAELTDAILPARFGTVHAPSVVADWLAATAERLIEALHLVAGREQMTLHVFESATADETGSVQRSDAPMIAMTSGAGARYLAERQRYWRDRAAPPELESLRSALGGLIAAERVEPRDAPGFRVSVYHLITRGQSDAYRDAVETHRDRVPGLHVRVSGPWAPYAFVPTMEVR